MPEPYALTRVVADPTRVQERARAPKATSGKRVLQLIDFVRLAVRLEYRIDPPARMRAPMATFATRRHVFEKDSTDQVLIGLEAEADLSDTKHWKASSVLELAGGEPGDDWSILPVHEVVRTRYNTGGYSALKRGVVLAEW